MKSKRESGFSLVEVMVGMVIGLIGVIIIMQVLSMAEAQRRATSGGADAQINGALGIFALERDIRQAGYGFTAVTVNGVASTPLLNCTVNAYNNTRSAPNFSFTAAPLIISPINIPAGDANSDVIQVAYGNSNAAVEGMTLSVDSASSVFPAYTLSSIAGLSVNDFVAFANNGLACWLSQVTAVTAATNTATTAAGQWNTAGGQGTVNYVKFDAATLPQVGATLFNLGNAPQVHVYAVRNGNLTLCDMLTSACENAALIADATVWKPITPGIVSLKVSYGRDTNATPLVVTTSNPPAPRAVVPDTWRWTENIPPGSWTTPDNTPIFANACFWERVPGVGVVLLAKSIQRAPSAVTTAAPVWRVGGGGTFTMTGTVLDPLPAGTNWQLYRYKVFETLIPLRNIVWMDKTGC